MSGGWHPQSDELTVDVDLLHHDLDAARAEIERLRAECRRVPQGFRPELNYTETKGDVEVEREGDPRFLALLDEVEALHASKQADYGKTGDPFANVRASEDFGIPGWVGAIVRANDKMRRLQAAARGSTLRNEGVEDSMIDLAVYSLIALVLYREQQ